MYHVAITPNTTPTNALSAQSRTLIGALGKLFAALDTLELDEYCVSAILEALEEAVDNLENDKPAKGTWTDMGCEDDSFSVDIFCEDDARYVLHDGHYWLAPHGAVGLVVDHLHEQWLYDEAEVSDWDNVLRPVAVDPEAGLDEAVRAVVNPTPVERLVVCKLRHLVDSDDDDADRYANRGVGGKATWDDDQKHWKVIWGNGAWGFYTTEELEKKAYYAEIPSLPNELPSPEPTIAEVVRNTKDGECSLSAIFSDRIERHLFALYLDEFDLSDSELMGLTEKQAHELKSKRDVEYLRS